MNSRKIKTITTNLTENYYIIVIIVTDIGIVKS